MKKGRYAAAGTLLKLSLRNDRTLTLLLVFLPLLFAYGAAVSNLAILRTPGELAAYVSENQGNALLGSIAAETIAGVTVWRIRTSSAIISSILGIVLTVDGMRRDEDLGRLELLRSGAVGPQAPLAAALLRSFGANLLGGAGMALGFLAAGFPAAGSLTAGLATALCCCAFCALSAVSAQLAPNARTARGLSLGAAAFFLLWQAAANAAGSERLLLFTPFGWCALARPFAGESPLPFRFAVPVLVLLSTAALHLSGRRDLGAGFLRERDGRASAKKGLKSPLALAWRLERGTFLVWAAAYGAMGLAIAALTPAIGRMLDGTPFLPELSARLGGAGRAFLAILAYILAQILAAYAVLAVLRLREEEAAARAELVLAGAVSRARYAAGFLLIAYAGSGAALALFGLCLGDFAFCISRLPAVWLVASLAVFLYGLAPRAAPAASWGLFGAFLLLEFLWELRFVGGAVFALSPFSWVYPGTAPAFLPLSVMLLLSAALVGAGLTLFSRRDLAG